MKRDFVCIHDSSHCTDNSGDSKLGLVESNQNTVNASYDLKLHYLSVDSIDFNLYCIKGRKTWYVFIIARNVSILLTIVVIKNLVEWIKSENGACFLPLQVSSTQSQWTRLRALFHLMERDLVCSHYHHKCVKFTDNSGDNKLGLVEKVRTRCMLPTTSSVINSM